MDPRQAYTDACPRQTERRGGADFGDLHFLLSDRLKSPSVEANGEYDNGTRDLLSPIPLKLLSKLHANPELW